MLVVQITHCSLWSGLLLLAIQLPPVFPLIIYEQQQYAILALRTGADWPLSVLVSPLGGRIAPGRPPC